MLLRLEDDIEWAYVNHTLSSFTEYFFMTVNWPYSQQYEDEISVQKGEVVGIVETNIGDAAMCKVSCYTTQC